jgi:hypothetical protein
MTGKAPRVNGRFVFVAVALHKLVSRSCVIHVQKLAV